MELPRKLAERFFFRSAQAQSLNLFRFLFCASVALQILARAARHERKLAGAPFNPIPLFEQFGIGQMSPDQFWALRNVLVAALILFVIFGGRRANSRLKAILEPLQREIAVTLARDGLRQALLTRAGMRHFRPQAPEPQANSNSADRPLAG